MHDRIYVDHNGTRFCVTATVDEDEGVIYNIVLWHFMPPRDTNPLIERFVPERANTPLHHAAIAAVEAAYGLCPVLEPFE
jgi:hypothetical protein